METIENVGKSGFSRLRKTVGSWLAYGMASGKHGPRTAAGSPAQALGYIDTWWSKDTNAFQTRFLHLRLCELPDVDPHVRWCVR